MLRSIPPLFFLTACQVSPLGSQIHTWTLRYSSITANWKLFPPFSSTYLTILGFPFRLAGQF